MPTRTGRLHLSIDCHRTTPDGVCYVESIYTRKWGKLCRDYSAEKVAGYRSWWTNQDDVTEDTDVDAPSVHLLNEHVANEANAYRILREVSREIDRRYPTR